MGLYLLLLGHFDFVTDSWILECFMDGSAELLLHGQEVGEEYTTMYSAGRGSLFATPRITAWCVLLPGN